MNKGKIIDVDKLKERIIMSSLGYNSIYCVFRLINELLKEQETNYCTCGNLSNCTTHNGLISVCYDCRIALKEEEVELSPEITNLERRVEQLEKELTEIKLKLKKDIRIAKVNDKYYPQYKNWLGYWVGFIKEIPHFDGTTNIEVSFKTEIEAINYIDSKS